MILNKGSVALIAVQQEEIPVLTQDTGPLLWRYELSLKDRSCSPLPSPPPPQTHTHTHARGTEDIFEVSNGKIILHLKHKQLSPAWYGDNLVIY